MCVCVRARACVCVRAHALVYVCVRVCAHLSVCKAQCRTDAATFTGSEGQDVPDGVESVVAVDLKDEVPGGLGADVDQLLSVRVVAHSCNSSGRDGG